MTEPDSLQPDDLTLSPEAAEDLETIEHEDVPQEQAVGTEPADLAWALQCVLFVAGEPLPAERLAQALNCDAMDIPRLTRELDGQMAGQGLQVVQLAGGYALATRAEFANCVQRLLEPEPERLSVQALESLAIIAYRQPITRPEIDALRGVNSAGVVASLLEKGLVRITGRKDVPGRPFLLETTAHFLSSFGLSELADLPRIDLPDVPAGEQPKLLGEALEDLSEASQEADPSALDA